MMSSFILPLIIVGIIIYGALKNTNVYDAFVEGSKESFDVIYTMFPAVLAMMLGINIILNSNFLEMVTGFLDPVLRFLDVPKEILPITLMRPISGSSSLAILNNIFINHGPDSFIGRLASVIQGSTDTTFYVLTLYFGCVGIKKIKYALWVGIIADIIGIVISILVVNYFF